MLRRLKADVEKSLPPKSETILFVGMSAMQKKLYKDILMRDIDKLNGGEGSSNAGRTAVLNIVMQLRKACNHPYLFPGQEDRSLDPLGTHLTENCGKMVLLDKLLKKMKQRGHRVLIFSQMTKMIDILEDYFLSKRYEYCRIDGNTTYEDREDRIAAFNKPNSEKFIFVLSTRAGGLGINLQTADTVILFDSDWNPQADLQAQDRAHRIGQKKPVQIFRLVTEDSVEVKVVERAQQKLKLDAMVVQQGRLADKEKKMSKEELLDTIKFGADKIFRSKESAISDADIDAILEEGRKKTLEMNSQLESAEKGDMYDFRLDGGMKAQEYDGIDYSDRTTRDAETAALAQLAFIDPGKRERKVVASYAESIQAAKSFAGEEADRKPKMPRHLRLPRMDDWQFYNKERLEQLHAIEEVKFEEMVEKGEYPIQGNVSKFVILEEALHKEKEDLLSQGFKEWTRVTFNLFVKCSAKHGRNDYEKIARDMYLEAEDVEKYATKFWTIGRDHLGEEEYTLKVKSIEKGEKAVEETNRLQEATSKLIQKFDDPWNELTFRYTGGATRVFNQEEDRFLLCLTHLHGYGNWERVRTSIRQSDHFRFDFYINSLTEEQIAKRCDTLMKSAERELLEIEKKEKGDSSSSSMKKSASTASLTNGNGSSSSSASSSGVPAAVKEESANAMDIALDPGSTPSVVPKNENPPPPVSATTEVGKMKVKEEVVKDEGALLKEIRAKLDSKLKSLGQLREQLRLAKDPSIALGKGPGSGKGGAGAKGAGAKGKAASGKTAGASKGIKGNGKLATTVPEHMLPALTQFIEANGSLNLDTLKTTFHGENPTIPKRQIEMKIREMTEEKTGPKDAYRLKPAFKKYVNMKASDLTGKAAAPKKRKATPTTSTKKAAKTDAAASIITTTGAPSAKESSEEPSIKKAKKELSGFQLFVKEKKKVFMPSVQNDLPDGDAESHKTELKSRIGDAWSELSEAEQTRYQEMAIAGNSGSSIVPAST
jgi:superfamily II DNA/RNA helicase